MVKQNYSIVVGITAVRAVHSLKTRSSLVIANTSATAVLYYGSDNSVTVTSGIPIQPKTNAVFLRGLGDRPDLERWVVSDTAATDVRIGEETEQYAEVV